MVLELGGKDPMIICDDADLEQAVSTAYVRGVQRLRADVRRRRAAVRVRRHLRRVRARGGARAKALRQGPPLQGEVDVGAMTMPRQLQIVQERWSTTPSPRGRGSCAAASRGPTCRATIYPPTVLVDVDHTMRITREEQFGPVMVILKVNSPEAEAVRLANDCPYGLGLVGVHARSGPRRAAWPARSRPA